MQVLTAERKFETRSANPLLPWGTSAPASNGQLGMSTAGVAVTEQTALQLAAVWGSVALISDSIATLPIRQWRTTTTEPKAMDLAPVIAEPWSELTTGPNQSDGALRAYLTQGTASFLLRGNVFGKIVAWDEKDNPAQVQLVHPDHVKIRRTDKGQVEVRYWNQVVPPDLVTRAMGLSVPEGLVGLNPIEAMRNSLGVARAQDLYGGAFFANQAQPAGVLQVLGDLSDDQTKAMKAEWLEAHQGINHAYLPAVLTGGTEWKPITMNHADAQFLEQMQFSESVISGRIYRVPPHMLGMVDRNTSWGAGIEQQELGFVRNTLLIWLARWEDLLTSWLPKGQFVTFDLSSRLRGDTLQRFLAYQIARVCGFMSNLDVLRAEGLTIPADAQSQAVLSAYDAPLNSAPVSPASGGAGGDKAN
jgi:HK97 family phage portal protein